MRSHLILLPSTRPPKMDVAFCYFWKNLSLKISKYLQGPGGLSLLILTRKVKWKRTFDIEMASLRRKGILLFFLHQSIQNLCTICNLFLSKSGIPSHMTMDIFEVKKWICSSLKVEIFDVEKWIVEVKKWIYSRIYSRSSKSGISSHTMDIFEVTRSPIRPPILGESISSSGLQIL